MQKALLLKALAVLLLGLALMIPLTMIDGLVRERQARQQQVTLDIAQSYAGEQQVAGPLLIVPYEEEYRASEVDPQTSTRREVWRRQARRIVLFPDKLDVAGKIDTNVKTRGLFRARVLDLQATLSGGFTLPAELPWERQDKDSRIIAGKPYLALAIGDPRGLSGAPRLALSAANGEQSPSFEQGSRIDAQLAGIHAPVDLPAPGKPQALHYTISLALTGTERVAFVPIAGDNRVDLQSSWPHPSFGGRFLPDPKTQSVTQDGFRAQWHVASLATRAQQQILAANCGPVGCLDTLDVRFIEPVNIYSQADRAIKYDVLFIGLTFAAFFLFEVMKRLPVHPAQYTLVGLALAMFFLLLLALSEHIAFGAAYLIAASACVGLVGFYLAGVLGSALRGAAFAGLLAALYGALYGLLVSEDNALLMGALLLFGVLGLAMWVTRRFDWYRMAPRGGAPGTAS
ncbi:MAG TPA: cell envelope integrity protein CreD [Rhodocyclaceae bacterium]|nr:cell envelope integrity protein CreD [Rhodocyclaceae bacterium]HMV54787.1 cell envelope integrity protein CreD [Rhodocyclaceae bacterium]HMZ83786.1 cell envelope integrity protein CreD [Rhodocyclaceae bacterium]HNA04350.1 cell envelope integrity protein CreD [Rhodocyclaceae bacterium]HNB78813.1 cell envelope integrity protein CreD [Rhodocyclaceae bacterium]